MKVKSIAECSLGAFCNTFDLHLVIIGHEKQFGLLFEWPLKTDFAVVVNIFSIYLMPYPSYYVAQCLFFVWCVV